MKKQTTTRRLIMFGAFGILIGSSNSCNRARSSLHDGQIVTISDQVKNQVIYRAGDKVFAVACEVGITERVLTRNDCPVDAKRDSSLSYKNEYLPELKRYLDYVESSELQSEIDAIDTILAELGAAAITESVNAERTGDGGFVRDSFAKQKARLRKQREKLLESQSNYEIKSEIYSAITTLLESPDTSKRLYHPGKTAIAMIFPFLSVEGKLKHAAVSRGEHSDLQDSPLSIVGFQSAVAIGTKMIVWGGFGNQNSADGAAFDATTRKWALLPKGQLTPRRNHSAVAIGTQMIIWGGHDDELKSDGALYDTSTENWSPVSKSLLTPREGHSAASVGNRMIIWGGYGDDPLNDGAIFDISNKKWTILPESPLTPRSGHSAVGIGSKMIVWGGLGSGARNDGAIFDTTTEKWVAMPPSPLSGRFEHSAAVIGTKMIIWGGFGGTQKNDGAVFDISTGFWSDLPDSPLTPRHSHSAVGIGSKMIVWSGRGDGPAKIDAAIFDIETFTWVTE